jgi:hypothetical protein
MTMRTIILAAIAVFALAGSASAQIINSPGKFCLRSGSTESKGMESCAYETMAQCNAAKGGQNDSCVPNSSMHGADKSATGSVKSTTGSGSKQ